MKKIYIALILLFGFLAFVPQIAVADLLPRNIYRNQPSETEIDKAIDQAKLLLCLYNKKINVPQKYQGPILKKQSLPIKGFDVASGFRYFGYGTGTGYPGKHPTKIIGYAAYNGDDCFEHLAVMFSEPFFYDITNVPPGSYLKYIRGPEDYEVFSPRQNSYKQFMWDKIKNLEEGIIEAQESRYIDDEEIKSDKLRKLQTEIRREYKLVDIPLSTPLEDFMHFFLAPDEEINEAPVKFGKNNDIPFDELKYSVRITEEAKPELKPEPKKAEPQEEKIKLKYSVYLDDENKAAAEKNYFDFIPNYALQGMLIALLLTLLIEGILAAPFGWKFVGIVSLANIITNPALNSIIWHYQIINTSTIILLEEAVVLIEWGIFSLFIRKHYGKLFLFSLFANAISYLSGFFIF